MSLPPLRPRLPAPALSLGAALLALLLTRCGSPEEGEPSLHPGPVVAEGHPLLGSVEEAVLDEAGHLPRPGSLALDVEEAVQGAHGASPATRIVVDDPKDGSVFPPEFVPPTFLWHDESPAADTWLVEITFASPEALPLRALVAGPPAPRGEIDPRALGNTNEVYEPTPYQASARSWTPDPSTWEEIKRRSLGTEATATFTGLSSRDLSAPLSRGAVRLQTSPDPVGAPIFYRDVPLMPAVGERGVIQPLSQDGLPVIAWRLRDVSHEESRLILTGMPSCGNCHSFSDDGSTFGMDVDGPQGDKGTYALSPLTKTMRIEYEDVISWNTFPDKPKGHRTIGFLSRVSPTGRYAVTTLNEALYVSNFKNYKYLQVFFPTRGILAFYDRQSGEMKALPGADDPAYVHCGADWSPDGSWLVFSRASAFDPYEAGRPLAAYPNDPNEPQIRYDLYRIPFHDGRGGEPVPLAGASNNGMSNSFPKVSPDGRWIVYTKCRNGLLMRPDGRLWIVPAEGGEAREMRCNTDNMNSWHSWSPNGRWLVFSSKINTPYTQMFLTHVDEQGNDTPPVLIPNSTAANRAVNIPEFVNAPYDALEKIEVPAVEHHRLFWQGLDELKAERFPEAEVLLRQAVEAEPTFSKAYTNLGAALAHQDRHEEAIAMYERALAVNRDDSLAHNNLGRSLEALGRPEEAYRHYEAALARNPELASARRNMVAALLRQGRPTEAAVHLERLIAQLPEDPEFRRVAVSLAEQTGRPAVARRHLEALVLISPDDVQAATTLAWILATSPAPEVRDGARAIELARGAVEATSSQRPEPLDALGAALAEAGRFDEAAAAVEKALALIAGRDTPLEAGLRQRLEGYRARRPYRTP